MLEFETMPDEIFSAILDASFILAADLVRESIKYNDDEYESLFSNSARVFSANLALKTIEKLLISNQKPGTVKRFV